MFVVASPTEAHHEASHSSGKTGNPVSHRGDDRCHHGNTSNELLLFRQCGAYAQESEE